MKKLRFNKAIRHKVAGIIVIGTPYYSIHCESEDLSQARQVTYECLDALERLRQKRNYREVN